MYRKQAAIVAGLVLILAACAPAAEKIVWKPIPDVLLQIDARPVKVNWTVYRDAKKSDPLLLQLGTRMLVIYVRNQAVYELKPEQFEHKGEDLLWRESDRPQKTIATSDWNTKDIGSAWRLQVKLADE